MPNAKVEVTGTTLVRGQTVTTDGVGAYVFASLPPGIFTVSASASGFVTHKEANLQVRVGKTLMVNIKMEVGAVTESVVVNADAVLIDLSQSTTSANISTEFMDRLPKGRTFDSLIAIAPGARNESKAGGFQIDGSSGSENSFVLDGVDVTNLQNGLLPVTSRIPPEFVQELQVKSSGFEAQYGGATGGVINAVLKSGSNDFHGSAGFFFNSDSMNARPRPSFRFNPDDDSKVEYFDNKKDGQRYIEPAFNLAGPIKKDKLWFLASWSPQLYSIDRTVTFLSNNRTGSYNQKVKYDNGMAKLDYAPFSKLRTSFTYLYTPVRLNGLLPSLQGTDSFSAPWADQGYRRPGANYNYSADFTATSRLIFSTRGGYNYRNYKDYGIPRGTRYRFANSNRALPPNLPVPANLQGPAGNFTANNFQTVFDKQPRWNLNGDVAYLTNIGGQQHQLKAGYSTNRINNQVSSTWPDGYIFIYWNLERQGVVTPGKFRGTYGYYIDRVFGTFGDVGSNNTGLYVQDNWQVTRRLTLNLGLRTEREFLPSFRTDSGIKSRAIEFGFSDKMAPRLGFALDVTGTGKFKISGFWGMFYDMMKYEMPRGSFGGDQWKDYVHALDDPDFTKIKTGNTPGRLFETVDWRIPSNDPSDNTIDPKLKPMRVISMDWAADYRVTNNVVLSARYVHKRLTRTIEDVGILTPQGEKYFIANPGFGLTADPKTWGPGIPVTPKAKRDYDGLEIRVDKRYSKGYQITSSYTYSRLYGNYSGLASSDENGRTSPNVNRYFDLPFMSYDGHGKLVEGLLATDRPHTFKFFGAKDFKSKLGTTTFSPIFTWFTGTPITSETGVFGVPVFYDGRGDLGRTPVVTETNLLVAHEWKMPKHERQRLRFELNFLNLFNQSTITNRDTSFVHPNDGGLQFDNEADFFKGFDRAKEMKAQDLRKSPSLGFANGFQGPRVIRFGIQYFF